MYACIVRNRMHFIPKYDVSFQSCGQYISMRDIIKVNTSRTIFICAGEAKRRRRT